MVKGKTISQVTLKKNLEIIQKELSKKKDIVIPDLLFAEHHQSHAAAAFYPSPFKEAVILCMDGVGEWATTSAWIGKVTKYLINGR